MGFIRQFLGLDLLPAPKPPFEVATVEAYVREQMGRTLARLRTTALPGGGVAVRVRICSGHEDHVELRTSAALKDALHKWSLLAELSGPAGPALRSNDHGHCPCCRARLAWFDSDGVMVTKWCGDEREATCSQCNARLVVGTPFGSIDVDRYGQTYVRVPTIREAPPPDDW